MFSFDVIDALNYHIAVAACVIVLVGGFLFLAAGLVLNWKEDLAKMLCRIACLSWATAFLCAGYSIHWIVGLCITGIAVLVFSTTIIESVK